MGDIKITLSNRTQRIDGLTLRPPGDDGPGCFNMGSISHRKKQAAFKSILLLVGIALFTVQVSDRFYVFANRPFCDTFSSSLIHKVHLSAKPVLSRDSCFSPDKRYQTETGFALLPPEIAPRTHLSGPHPECFGFNETVVKPVFPVTALRGPPVL